MSTKISNNSPADQRPADSNDTTKHYPPTEAEFDEATQRIAQGEVTLDTSELEELTKGLSDLAEEAVKDNKFTAGQAKQEQALRIQFLKVTKSFFASRLERGKVLMQYQRLYAPLGLLSRFLEVVGVDRASAYRWIDLAEAEEEATEVTEAEVASTEEATKVHTKQSPFQTSLRDDLATKVKDIIRYAKQAIKDLAEAEAKAVLGVVMDGLKDYKGLITAVGEVPQPAEVILTDGQSTDNQNPKRKVTGVVNLGGSEPAAKSGRQAA